MMAQCCHLLVHSPSLGLELNSGHVHSRAMRYHCAMPACLAEMLVKYTKYKKYTGVLYSSLNLANLSITSTNNKNHRWRAGLNWYHTSCHVCIDVMLGKLLIPVMLWALGFSVKLDISVGQIKKCDNLVQQKNIIPDGITSSKSKFNVTKHIYRRDVVVRSRHLRIRLGIVKYIISIHLDR